MLFTLKCILGNDVSELMQRQLHLAKVLSTGCTFQFAPEFKLRMNMRTVGRAPRQERQHRVVVRKVVLGNLFK